MKKRISKINAVDSITRIIIDGSKESFNKMFSILKSKKFKNILSESMPEIINEEEIINFTIFRLFLELQVLKNIFKEVLADELKNMSIDTFSKILDFDKDLLVKEILVYEKIFNDDIKAGANPFDSLGILSILCEKLKFKKEEISGKKVFNPILTTFINSWVGPVGFWKKVSEEYNFKE